MSFPISGEKLLSVLIELGYEFEVEGDLSSALIEGVGPLSGDGENLMRFCRSHDSSRATPGKGVGGVVFCGYGFRGMFSGTWVRIISEFPELLFRKSYFALIPRAEKFNPVQGALSSQRELDVFIGSEVHLHPSVRVGFGTVIRNSRVEENVVIGENCVLGNPGLGHLRSPDGDLVPAPHFGSVEVGRGVQIGDGTVIDRSVFGSTKIGEGSVVGTKVHVSHGVSVGRKCFISHGVELSGSVTIADSVTIWSRAVVRDHVSIGEGAIIGMGAVVIEDVPAGTTVVGNPARPIS